MAWPLTPRLAYRGFPVTIQPATEKFIMLSALYWKWFSRVSALKYFDMPLKKLSSSKKSHLICSWEINLYFEHKTYTFMIFPFLLKCWADTERIIVHKVSQQVHGCLVRLHKRRRAKLSKMLLKIFFGFLFSLFPCKIGGKRIFNVTLIWKWSKPKQETVWNITQEMDPADHTLGLEVLREMEC